MENPTKIIVANWKMNGSIELCKQFIPQIQKLKFTKNTQTELEIIFSLPFVYMSDFKKMLHSEKNAIHNSMKISIGAQNCSKYQNGAHTGEISATMLKEFGCTHVILGHSERRKEQKETAETIKNKVDIVLESGMKPIVCIGESLEIFEKGETITFLETQIDALEETIKTEISKENLLLAYEPIWAIGTGKVPSNEIIQKVHTYIRNKLNTHKNLKILYGGSVNEKNAHSILQIPNVDGLLVGGASLKPEQFIQICLLG
jgi:triosephosphate isomerase (TIM)